MVRVDGTLLQDMKFADHLVDIIAEAEGGDVGGDAYVDWVNNLTYIDITVVSGGGNR